MDDCVQVGIGHYVQLSSFITVAREDSTVRYPGFDNSVLALALSQNIGRQMQLA